MAGPAIATTTILCRRVKLRFPPDAIISRAVDIRRARARPASVVLAQPAAVAAPASLPPPAVLRERELARTQRVDLEAATRCCWSASP